MPEGSLLVALVIFEVGKNGGEDSVELFPIPPNFYYYYFVCVVSSKQCTNCKE